MKLNIILELKWITQATCIHRVKLQKYDVEHKEKITKHVQYTIYIIFITIENNTILKVIKYQEILVNEHY